MLLGSCCAITHAAPHVHWRLSAFRESNLLGCPHCCAVLLRQPAAAGRPTSPTVCPANPLHPTPPDPAAWPCVCCFRTSALAAAAGALGPSSPSGSPRVAAAMLSDGCCVSTSGNLRGGTEGRGRCQQGCVRSSSTTRQVMPPHLAHVPSPPASCTGVGSSASSCPFIAGSN